MILFTEKVKATAQAVGFHTKLLYIFKKAYHQCILCTTPMEVDKETNLSLNSANGFKLTMHVYSEGWREYNRSIIL
jgi:hypothetical protein